MRLTERTKDILTWLLVAGWIIGVGVTYVLTDGRWFR